jgi:prevent-host-death family protein
MFYNELMAQIGIRELNQRTSQVLDRVRAGEIIEVTDRGEPVAEIRPISAQRAGLARLVAEGRVVPAAVDAAVVSALPMDQRDTVNVADWLAADREQERS